jgi:hypothetical protein
VPELLVLDDHRVRVQRLGEHLVVGQSGRERRRLKWM